MTLLNKFTHHYKNKLRLTTTQHQLILAVSGGVDSVVLVDLCNRAGFKFVVAHCNFNLRGEESKRDEEFVRSLVTKYGVDLLLKDFNTKEYATTNKISIQVAARALRYHWFEEILTQKNNYRDNHANDSIKRCFLATAHHADDNIETLLLNFFRGTGISGLHGILPKQGNIIRPLLFAKKEEIMAYAKEQNLEWKEDSSNELDKYSRNFIRHQVVPLMKSIYPNVDDNLLSNIERFKEIEAIYNTSINQIKTKLIEVKGSELHIPILKLKNQSPINTIVFEIIKDYGYAASQTIEVVKLLDAANGSFIASNTHRLIINRNWLIIAPLETEEATNIIIEEGTEVISFKEGNLFLIPFSYNKESFSTEAFEATINLSEVKWPLLLRPYKQGDYFYPLGMLKKKKLSKFFIDQKLSKTEKEKVWVIESDKRIIWVVGYRIDNRFKIKPSTNAILNIKWKK